MPMRLTACEGKTSVKETEFNLKGDKRNIFFAVEFACSKATAWAYNSI